MNRFNYLTFFDKFLLDYNRVCLLLLRFSEHFHQVLSWGLCFFVYCISVVYVFFSRVFRWFEYNGFNVLSLTKLFYFFPVCLYFYIFLVNFVVWRAEWIFRRFVWRFCWFLFYTIRTRVKNSLFGLLLSFAEVFYSVWFFFYVLGLFFFLVFYPVFLLLDFLYNVLFKL
jgi:hypothetical protein